MKKSLLTCQNSINWLGNEKQVGKMWVGSWDFSRKEGNNRCQVKSYGPANDNLDIVIEKSARNELNNPDSYPHIIRELTTVEGWLLKETIPTKKNNSKVAKEFKVIDGDNITLYDEGKFKVYHILDKGIYSENPWLKLISLENGNTIAMSLNTLIRKLNIDVYKKLNYPIVFGIANMASYWRTIGHLSKHGAVLRVRTTPKTRNLVLKSYEKLTGHKISKDIEEKYIDHNPNLQTFTDNAHLYFPTVSKEVRDLLHFPSNMVGKHEGKVNNGIEKIHNTEFVWTLFSYGFRLGNDHDSEKIRNHVEINSNEFIAAFEEGNNEWLI